MNHWLPHPLLTPLLALIWLLLVNSLAPGQILLGLLLGWTIPRFTLKFWPDRVRLRQPWMLFSFTARLLWDILIANLAVAWLILRGPKVLHPGFVEVPLELRSDLALSVLANAISLTPGSVSAWLSPDRRTLVVHALDARDPQRLAQTIKERYEAPLCAMFFE